MMNNKNPLPEVNNLRWLSNMFPFTEKPEDDTDKMSNAIHVYCTAAADKLEEYAAKGPSFYYLKCDGCIEDPSEECFHCSRAYEDCYKSKDNEVEEQK